MNASSLNSRKSKTIAYWLVGLGLAVSSASVTVASTVHSYKDVCGTLPAFPTLLQKAGFFAPAVCKLVAPGKCSEKTCLLANGRGVCVVEKIIVRGKPTEECKCMIRGKSGGKA